MIYSVLKLNEIISFNFHLGIQFTVSTIILFSNMQNLVNLFFLSFLSLFSFFVINLFKNSNGSRVEHV